MDGETGRPTILDKNHGFMKFIIKNQIDRENFDREQKIKQYLKDCETARRTDQQEQTGGGRINFSAIICPEKLDSEGLADNVVNVEAVNKKNKHYNEKETEIKYDKVPIKLDTLLFKLEFLTNGGDIVNVPVRNEDSPEIVVERVIDQYHLNSLKQEALLKRVSEEMNKFLVRGRRQ